MATAQQDRRTNGGQTKPATESHLDDVIRETESRKSNVISSAATVLMIDPRKLCDMLRNVWKTSNGQKPLDNDEMFAGISMIARYELDPIAREVYVTRDNKGRLLTVIGVDGWIKILDRTDHYDGMEQEIHEEKGIVDWIETRIYSNKRKYPAVYKAFMSEYRAIGGFMLDKIPIHMLGIYSLRHAARRFTPLGAHVVTEEEAIFMGAGTFDGTPQQQRSGKSKADELADQLAERVLDTSDSQETTDHTENQDADPPEPQSNPVQKPTTTKPADNRRRDPGPTHMVGKPTLAGRFEEYQRELNDCLTAQQCQACYDMWFGKDSNIQWTPEFADMGYKARDERIAFLRNNKPKSNGNLFEKPSPVHS